MKTPLIGAALSLTLIAVTLVAAVPAASERVAISSDKDAASTVVSVRDVQARDGVVSGVLANQSNRLVRDVKLVIRHAWLWKNERHPGTDNPGRSDSYTIAGEIPPGGSLPFTYRVDPPLPQRSDGRFTTSVEVIGFTEVGW